MRWFHTARHLRAQQVYGQLRRQIGPRPGGFSRNGQSKGPDFPGCRWPDGRAFLPPANVGLCQEAICAGRWQFLNVSEEIGFPPDWDGERPSRLWQYNLHYFDWLWLLDFEAARDVVLDWIARYPDRGGRVGWEPYPTSVRLMNWCGLFFGRFRRQTQEDTDFGRALWRSLYRQCERLSRCIETHLLNNHTLENGAALAFVGSCFHGRDAQRWLARGGRILADQIAAQVLPDGMHFELSPMYHCRVLYVLGLLSQTQTPAVAELVAGPLSRMSQALGKICHPDGQIALFGDSALDVYHGPASLGLSGSGPGCFALPDAGYYGWRGADGTYLIADYGGIGPDHNPGHGHADMFGFELSLNGCRVITDCGLHDYEPSETRRYCRSTAAHNTVEIDGQDQCELWGAFRVARRGSPRHVVWQPGSSGFALEGWHDGYARLRGRPVHARLMQWDAAVGLTVRDTIRANRPVRCVSRLHLHPACRIVESYGRSVRVAYASGEFVVEANGEIAIEDSQYCTRFYQTQSRSCLCLAGCGNPIELKYRIRV